MHPRVWANCFALTLLTVPSLALAGHMPKGNPSQQVECDLVDSFIETIPHGNGDGSVTDDEVGPGGWRFNGGGQSFVTFAYDLNMTEDGYVVDAGRSNVGTNTGIINDYPAELDLPQDPKDDVLTFDGPVGVITLSGGDEFQLPGKDTGEVRIVVHDPEGDGTYEGCAKTPQLTNFGFTKKEGGAFVQIEYFKAYAEADEDGTVIFYETSEISTFNNTTSGN